jgi:hypothetical protein
MVDSISAAMNSASDEGKGCRAHAFKVRGMRKKFELMRPGKVAGGDDKTTKDFLDRSLGEKAK